MRSSSPYRERICGQSVSAAVGARSWIEAIAAWIWYSPTAPRAIAESRRAVPSAIRSRSQRPSVLFGQRDEVSVSVGAGRSPGVDQQHEGQEARDLCVVGEVAADHPREPDGFDRELDALEIVARACCVALVEDQVENVEDRPRRGGSFGGGRQPERNPGFLDPLLGSRDPLGHGRLGHEEGGGDLARRQASDRSQRERDRRGRCQRRMAAQVQDRQRVVVVRGLGGRRVGLEREALAIHPGMLASVVIDQAAARRPDQPAARIRRQAFSRPMVHSRDQRFLDGILGRVEVARSSGQDGEDLRRQVAQQVLGENVVAQRTPPAVSR